MIINCSNIFLFILKLNKCLRDVNLSHNGFGDKAAEVLGPAIGKSQGTRGPRY